MAPNPHLSCKKSLSYMSSHLTSCLKEAFHTGILDIRLPESSAAHHPQLERRAE